MLFQRITILKGVRYNDACRLNNNEMMLQDILSTRQTFLGSETLTYLRGGISPPKIISLPSTNQAWSCRNLLKTTSKEGLLYII